MRRSPRKKQRRLTKSPARMKTLGKTAWPPKPPSPCNFNLALPCLARRHPSSITDMGDQPREFVPHPSCQWASSRSFLTLSFSELSSPTETSGDSMVRYSLHFKQIPLLSIFLFTFLDAPSHLYKRVCPSVRPSVRRSVRRSVRPALFSDAY